MATRCPNCDGKYGLVGYWQYGEVLSFGLRFCSLNCKYEHALKKAAERAALQKALDTKD